MCPRCHETNLVRSMLRLCAENCRRHRGSARVSRPVGSSVRELVQTNALRRAPRLCEPVRVLIFSQQIKISFLVPRIGSMSQFTRITVLAFIFVFGGLCVAQQGSF